MLTQGNRDRGAKLDMLIKSCGLTQKGLAEAIGIDPARLSEWKQGRWRMPVEVGVRLAKALGVTAEYLVDPSQDGPPARLEDDARYLLRVIADAGLTPGEVARDLLQSLRGARTRPPDRVTDLEILDLPATASDPHATAPPVRYQGKPRTG